MQAANRTIGRLNDGSIDYAFYKRRAAQERKNERTMSTLRALRRAGRATLWLASGAAKGLVRFWNVAPLGVADRIGTRSGRI